MSLIKYPDRNNNPKFLKTIYKKAEFQRNKYKKRENLDTYEKIKEHRDEICGEGLGFDFSLLPHQVFLSNFINPNSPYKSLLLFHGTGVGKTCAAISIAENFKEQVKKYNTKIYVLAPSTLLKNNFVQQLMGPCTGNEYFNQKEVIYNPKRKHKAKRLAQNKIHEYYEIISYRKFLNKVLGEKIRDRFKKYIKNKKGEHRRDLASDPITHLSNTIIIVDEAHNLTNNDEGKSLLKIIRNKKSTNLRVVLLTATPMKDTGTDIIYLMNLILPIDKQLIPNKMFNVNTKELLPGGLDYFKKMCRGYISHLRGADPITFAKRVDVGVVSKGLTFTKVIKCPMIDFQLELYQRVDKENKDPDNKHKDPLARNLGSIANIIIPGLNQDRNKILGFYGNEGIKKAKDQLKYYLSDLISVLKKKYPKIEIDNKFIYLSRNGNITGKFMSLKYLKPFSSKFHQAVTNINNNVTGKLGAGLQFVYFNLVETGTKIFEEVLIQNGYVNYEDKLSSRDIETICYLCGFTEKKHPKDHTFSQAYFISLTGETPDLEDSKIDSQERQEELLSIFNSPENIQGKHIKIILGSSIFKEGVNLKNIKDIHILEPYFNLTRIDQVIGRGIRHCSHIKQMTRKNPFPEVKVYKYVVGLLKGLSNEEMLYKLSEWKYKLIKRIERAMKEITIDCPFNYPNNMFPEEMEKYKDCIKKNNCPAVCDFTECSYKCDNPELNKLYFHNNEYKSLDLKDLDTSTFNPSLVRNEIGFCKNKIKELYRKNTVHILSELVDFVRKHYPKYRKKLFDPFFVYKALTELMPINDNDFNNLKDVMYDKFNREGYLIQRGKYYIFQLFNETERIPIVLRKTYDDINNITHSITLKEYLVIKGVVLESEEDNWEYEYDMEYYNSRPENDVIGIVTRESTRKFSRKKHEIKDVFNIRPSKTGLTEKKRGKGLFTEYGANCLTKHKPELKQYARLLKIDLKSGMSKEEICSLLKKTLIKQEKYSTDGRTYVRIPKNHPKYHFPYNLKDRYKYLKRELEAYFQKSSISVTINYKKAVIEVDNTLLTVKDREFMKELRGELKKNWWIFKIE